MKVSHIEANIYNTVFPLRNILSKRFRESATQERVAERQKLIQFHQSHPNQTQNT